MVAACLCKSDPLEIIIVYPLHHSEPLRLLIAVLVITTALAGGKVEERRRRGERTAERQRVDDDDDNNTYNPRNRQAGTGSPP